MEPTSLPTWDHLTYSIPPNSIGADLHPFQEYILKMAAVDYVHRPPELTESGEEMNFYLGFEDQHHLLLSWVLDNGYTEPPHHVRPQNNLFQRHPLAVAILDTALEVSVTQSTIRRFSERALPVALAQYAERNSASLSGFRMNVLWTAAERYAEMVITDAAVGGDERHVIDENPAFALVIQERRPKGAVYIQDVNLATFCVVNAEFEKYVFNKESSCNWWWDEESHADKIRELLKHTIRLALDKACKARGVELVIYPTTMVSCDGDNWEPEDSYTQVKKEDLHLEDKEPSEDPKSTEEDKDDQKMPDAIVDAGMGNKSEDSGSGSDSDSDSEVSFYGCCPRARTRSPTYSPRDGSPSDVSPRDDCPPDDCPGDDPQRGDSARKSSRGDGSPYDDCEGKLDQGKPDEPYFEDFTGTSFTTANVIQPSDLNRSWKPYQLPLPTRNIIINGKWVCVEVPDRKLSPTITNDMLQDYPKPVNLGHLFERVGGSYGKPEKRRANMPGGKTDKPTQGAAAVKPKPPKKITSRLPKKQRQANKAFEERAKQNKRNAPEEVEAWDYSSGKAPKNVAEFLRGAENGDIERALAPATTGVAEGAGAQGEGQGGSKRRKIWLRGKAPGDGDGRALSDGVKNAVVK